MFRYIFCVTVRATHFKYIDQCYQMLRWLGYILFRILFPNLLFQPRTYMALRQNTMGVIRTFKHKRTLMSQLASDRKKKRVSRSLLQCTEYQIPAWYFLYLHLHSQQTVKESELMSVKRNSLYRELPAACMYPDKPDIQYESLLMNVYL